MEDHKDDKNYASIGNGSWFNKIKQGSDNSNGGGVSFWKVFLAILGAMGSIATVIGVLYTLGVLK